MFQFTRPGGRDLALVALGCLRAGFQFTRPGGRDPRLATYYEANNPVSIHAPGWARRSPPSLKKGTRPCFNSRARVGATRRGQNAFRVVAGFNSRARVGATPPFAAFRIWLPVFQFTRPGGRDTRRQMGTGVTQGFNSRARVGATRRPPPTNSSPPSFQFTRPGGRDNNIINCWSGTNKFQFTRPGGRDITWFGINGLETSFNSRARVGATPWLDAWIERSSGFNSRARVGATEIF